MLRPALFLLLFAVTVLLSLPGCGPRISDAELGEKLDRLPQIEGANEPYPLPGIDETLEAAREGEPPRQTTPAVGPSLPKLPK